MLSIVEEDGDMLAAEEIQRFLKNRTKRDGELKIINFSFWGPDRALSCVCCVCLVRSHPKTLYVDAQSCVNLFMIVRSVEHQPDTRRRTIHSFGAHYSYSQDGQ